MDEFQAKIAKSANALGVMLGIPAFVDPDKGFTAEKVITWENGDKIQVNVVWDCGSFSYSAVLGQIDPKTNELSFVSGDIAKEDSLEKLIIRIDDFLKSRENEREEVEASQDVVNDYINLSNEIQDLVLDPDYDRQTVNNKYAELGAMESKLHELGIVPSSLFATRRL